MKIVRSSELDLTRYDTDKIPNGYLERYDPILAPYVGKAITLLEIGVFKGGSLRLWRDYFPQGTIVGIDTALPPEKQFGDRIRFFQGSQTDREFLDQVATETAPEGFDIIIDDASHIASLTQISFWHLFDNHLKPGGLYVIEDWGTGYWDDWPDGKKVRPVGLAERVSSLQGSQVRPLESHQFGMVGFVKQLVDEQGAADLSRGYLHGKPGRESKFESMTITPSIVFIRKHP